MQETNLKNRWKIASFGTYVFLLSAIFATELTIMEMGPAFKTQSDRLAAAFLDAFILTGAFSLPLFLFSLRLNSEEVNRRAPWGLFLQTLTAIFLIEFMVMLFLPVLSQQNNSISTGLIDAGLTMLLSAVPIWWLFRRLEEQNRRVTLEDYLNSPTVLNFLLLFMVFQANLVLEILLPRVLLAESTPLHEITNAALTTLCLAPLFWILITRPLQRAALSEYARTRAVYAQVIDAVITFDVQGRIECFNPAAQRIFGYTTEKMVGGPVSQLFVDGERLVEELFATISSEESFPVKVFSYELLGRRQDGSQVTMDVSISKVELQDRSEFLLIMRDITERKLTAEALKASETRFRQIFEKTDDAVIFLHPRNHSIIDLNETMVNLFGYNHEELREGGLKVILRADDHKRVMALIKRMAPNETPQLENLVGICKDGSGLIISMRVKTMHLQDIEIVYCTFRDVTDRVRMEAEAREIQSKLIQANKMTALGLMVSGVAHEINNPNNFILTNSQILERSWQDACKILNEYYQENGDFLLGGLPFSQIGQQAPQLFGGIIEGSRRINEIVANLKGFARQETVSLDSEVEINQVVKSAITILRHEIGRMTENFRFEPAENLPRVKGNRHQIGQVIVNLLMNACQALPDKSAAVTLHTYQDQEADQIVVVIHDEGHGMLPEEAARIMEPFFTTKLDSGGTGLGLSICRSIIKDHKGVLDFRTEPGQGTTFFVKLPAMESYSADSEK